MVSSGQHHPPGIQELDRYAYVNNSPLNYIDPSGYEPHTPGSCYGEEDHNCGINNEKHKQDILYSQVFEGSGKDGTWTEEDWGEYLNNRDMYWDKPSLWAKSEDESWESFATYVQKLASYYDFSITAQKDQFVRDFGLLFGGISSANNWEKAAIASAHGPEISPILNLSNKNLGNDYLDSFGGNQSHHYAGIFFLGYFAEPETAFLVNAGRDLFDKRGINYGDINLGTQASIDAYNFRYYAYSGDFMYNYIIRLIDQ